MSLVGLQYVYERRRVDSSTALGYFKANAFVVVFLCYPGVCNQAFSIFNCRKLDGGLSVLIKDYSVLCSTDRHYVFQLLAAAYILVVSLGIPLYMVFLMMRRMQEYSSASATDRFVARRVADELKLDDRVAADSIRDVSTGREYSFLVSAVCIQFTCAHFRCKSIPNHARVHGWHCARQVNAYKPRFYYWEGYDMARKLLLVGMLVVAGRGSVAQLFLAVVISFASFSLQVKLEPYKHKVRPYV
jgi:hypothetical protein